LVPLERTQASLVSKLGFVTTWVTDGLGTAAQVATVGTAPDTVIVDAAKGDADWITVTVEAASGEADSMTVIFDAAKGEADSTTVIVDAANGEADSTTVIVDAANGEAD
jgi:DNA-binding response OmpR family regulator